MRERWVCARHVEQAQPSGETPVVNPEPAAAGQYAVVDVNEAVTVRLDP